MEKIFNEHKFVICHDGEGTVHHSEVDSGVNLSSGQPYYEEFDDKEEWEARLKELGVNLAPLSVDRSQIKSIQEEKMRRRGNRGNDE